MIITLITIMRYWGGGLRLLAWGSIPHHWRNICFVFREVENKGKLKSFSIFPLYWKVCSKWSTEYFPNSCFSSTVCFLVKEHRSVQHEEFDWPQGSRQSPRLSLSLFFWQSDRDITVLSQELPPGVCFRVRGSGGELRGIPYTHITLHHGEQAIH